MKTKTIEQLITAYKTRNQIAKEIDASVSKLAMSRQKDTYLQCLKICEYINRKQELINLCLIFEEEISRTNKSVQQKVFLLWLAGETSEENAKQNNISLCTAYRYVISYKASLTKQFTIDGYTDEILQEKLSNVMRFLPLPRITA